MFLPRPQHAALPALVVELKWNRDAETAIRQIEEKRYPKALEGHAGEMLLVGISYDRETRKHECRMERCSK